MSFHRLTSALKCMAILLVLGLVSQCAQAQKSNAEIFGTWRVTKVVDSAEIVGLSYRQAKSLVGKTATIAEDGFHFDGEDCLPPTYARTRENTFTYFRESMHASTENLRLPEVITVIDAGCTFIYPRNAQTIMFHWEGFFFDAKKLAQ